MCVCVDISLQMYKSGLWQALLATNLLFPDNKLNLDDIMTLDDVD